MTIPNPAIKDVLKAENERQNQEDKLRARSMLKFNPQLFNQDSIMKEKSALLNWGRFG